MNQIKHLNDKEIRELVPFSASWHQDYRDSNWIYVGGLDGSVHEEDVIRVFAQYGMINDLIMPRDGKTIKGHAFVEYSIFKSAVLAVDNFNGIKWRDRLLKVDHAKHIPQKEMRFDVMRNRRKYLVPKVPKDLRDTDDGRRLERLLRKIEDCDLDQLRSYVEDYQNLYKEATKKTAGPTNEKYPMV